MYRYDEIDQQAVDERVAQFRDQVRRRLDGELTEDEFKPLRLMNGLYLQLRAYMLRIAIPYGMLSSDQMRLLARIAVKYDKGYGHFTTRQNIQFNWIKLEQAPDLLAELAAAEMHAIQTSGNCIRNTTADPYAGAAADEIEDPRIWSEIIRQWSTFHPEFSFLPRKFKIALSGATSDRAAIRVHDIGLQMLRDDAGEVGFQVAVGGGQGRTPYIAETIREFLPKRYLLSYLEAIMRVYNQFGRRDNIYKARIKILVQSVGAARFAEMVEAEWQNIKDGVVDLPEDEVARIRAQFAPPAYDKPGPRPIGNGANGAAIPAFDNWMLTNVIAHRQPAYAIVNISLKPTGGVPGDATAADMDKVAALADRFSFGEIRVTHEQNLVLAHVRRRDLHELWQALDEAGLATANIGLVSDIIACPGLDYCNLATARSIPVAQEISERFADMKRQQDIGGLTLNISGCINACGHHHVGNIGLLGLEKNGEEFYQITLGGAADGDAAIGAIVGPGFSGEDVVDAVETIVDTYLAVRRDDEKFIDTYRRVGNDPFKEKLYATH
jgi:sulfite reductase (NADPH) hemoprotein beta-component